MRLASRPGSGTIVTFRFPEKDPPDAAGGDPRRVRAESFPFGNGNGSLEHSMRASLDALMTLADDEPERPQPGRDDPQ
jgi:hypothetical protein